MNTLAVIRTIFMTVLILVGLPLIIGILPFLWESSFYKTLKRKEQKTC